MVLALALARTVTQVTLQNGMVNRKSRADHSS